MMGLLFALGGAVAGVAQAILLARASRGGPSALSFLLRLLIVGAALFFAARAGHLGAAAVGWFVAFVASAALVRWRLR